MKNPSILTILLPIFVTIVFVFLKIFNLINWHWAWVISPIWITIAIVVFIVAIGLIFLPKDWMDINKDWKN
jgi:energy-coupling factor transporter transmembrane protein EcfT